MYYCLMNDRIGSLYLAIIDNKAVCFETNLKDFVYIFTIIEPAARNYDWFYRQFKKSNMFTALVSHKQYHFQRLV